MENIPVKHHFIAQNHQRRWRLNDDNYVQYFIKEKSISVVQETSLHLYDEDLYSLFDGNSYSPFYEQGFFATLDRDFAKIASDIIRNPTALEPDKEKHLKQYVVGSLSRNPSAQRLIKEAIKTVADKLTAEEGIDLSGLHHEVSLEAKKEFQSGNKLYIKNNSALIAYVDQLESDLFGYRDGMIRIIELPKNAATSLILGDACALAERIADDVKAILFALSPFHLILLTQDKCDISIKSKEKLVQLFNEKMWERSAKVVIGFPENTFLAKKGFTMVGKWQGVRQNFY